jgi:hypothetical protein
MPAGALPARSDAAGTAGGVGGGDEGMACGSYCTPRGLPGAQAGAGTLCSVNSLLMIHVAAGAAVVAAAAAVAAWGIARGRRLRLGGPAREDRGFTQLVALTQTLVLGCGVLGVMLLAGPGAGPDDPLHARVYGPFMAAALLGAWSFRTADARWNVRVFAVASLFVMGLGVRAFFTG